MLILIKRLLYLKEAEKYYKNITIIKINNTIQQNRKSNFIVAILKKKYFVLEKFKKKFFLSINKLSLK